jgi:hypothetical protein
MSRFSQFVILAFAVSAHSAALEAQTVLYQVPGETPWSRAGTALAPLGDLDGDGASDFAVGMPGSDLAGPGFGGAVAVSGADGHALFAVHGAVSGGMFGFALGGGGDVDGDGVPDLIVGAPYDSNMTGSVYVFSGANQALLHTFSGSQPYDQFGCSVASAGDVDADGHADILVGAIQYQPFGTSPGYAEVYSGADGTRLYHWSGSGPGMQIFGRAVAGAGDVDGDGRDDLIVSASSEASGTVRVYSGLDGSVLRTLAPGVGGEQFGWSVAGGRDVDGDLVPDVVVGGLSWSNYVGRATVWSGASGALLAEYDGSGNLQMMGASVAWIEDLDLNGRPEIAVGSYGDPLAQGSMVQIFPGGGGVALLTLHGDPTAAHLGLQPTSVLGLGDVDGDGHPDLAVGADEGQTGGTGFGWVRVYSTATLPPALVCPGKLNSLGCQPTLAWTGTPSFSGPDDFLLTCSAVVPHVRGFLAWSREPALVPFMGGTLAPGQPWRIAFWSNSGGTSGSCSGQLSGLFPQAYASAQGLLPGATVFAQYIYRDRQQPDGTGYGLGPGVRFTFWP